MAPKRRLHVEDANTEAHAKSAKTEQPRRSTRLSTSQTDTANGTAAVTSKNVPNTTSKDSRKRGNKTSSRAENQNVENKIKVSSSNARTRDSESTPAAASLNSPDESSFWLMKAEPESRIEKGKDVKFSIDDLAAVDKEPWDGVRNLVARNNMRAMKKGEKAFFYHSNCKIPGIAGIMQIEEEHSVDESAFNPEHPYYDEKSSRDNPKWSNVHVKFLKKLETFVSLKELQRFRGPSEELANMQVLRMSRLSVSRVSKKEWNFICRELAKIDPETLESSA